MYKHMHNHMHMDMHMRATICQEHHGTPLLSADYGDVDSESLMHPRTNSNANPNGNARGDTNGNEGNENTSEKKFVFLDQFRLLPKRDGWGAVANLDLFLTSLYHYYYHRGIVPIIGKGVVELISLFFTLWLSVFLFQYLDWRKLWNCRDEESCEANLSDYIIESPFASVSIWNFLIVLYILLFTAYGLFAISTFLTSIRQALEAKHIYEDKHSKCPNPREHSHGKTNMIKMARHYILKLSTSATFGAGIFITIGMKSMSAVKLGIGVTGGGGKKRDKNCDSSSF
eukprot:191392_1